MDYRVEECANESEFGHDIMPHLLQPMIQWGYKILQERVECSFIMKVCTRWMPWSAEAPISCRTVS